MDVEKIHRWPCHIHGRSAKCFMRKYNGHYYHVIPVSKNVSLFAQQFNKAHAISPMITDEFAEDLGPVFYVTPVGGASCMREWENFKKLLGLFKSLDVAHVQYATEYNSVSDFLGNHFICDGESSIIMCNKHLLKKCGGKKNPKPQVKYTKGTWTKAVLKGVFPKIDTVKGVPTNTPTWAIDMIQAINNKNG